MKNIGHREEAPIETVEGREATPQEIETVVHLLFGWWIRNFEEPEKAPVEANLTIDNPNGKRDPK